MKARGQKLENPPIFLITIYSGFPDLVPLGQPLPMGYTKEWSRTKKNEHDRGETKKVWARSIAAMQARRARNLHECHTAARWQLTPGGCVCVCELRAVPHALMISSPDKLSSCGENTQGEFFLCEPIGFAQWLHQGVKMGREEQEKKRHGIVQWEK